MKNLLIFAVLLLAGCASFQEAYLLDREFGQASQAAWEQQIVNPEGQMVHRNPEGMEGITAEEVMGVYNGTFAEKPQQLNVLGLGLTE